MEKQDILKKYKPEKDNILLILQDFQNNNPYNYISNEDIKLIAEYLRMTYGEVYGTVGYYSMFSTKPRGKNIIRLCASPVCNMMGSETIASVLKEVLNIEFGQTTPDKLFSLEESECLGYCNDSPVMMINEKTYSGLTPKKVKQLLTKFNT